MSDLLIKGMEMPQSCSNCNWSRYSFPNAWCSMTHHKVDIEVAKNGRPDDCPLIEVPEPHGDLIDRDALPTPRVEWEDIVNATAVIPASEEG